MTTRREILKLATLAGAGRFGAMNAFAQGTDYKALVCVFLFGGCDANNMIVPQGSSEYDAYKRARGTIALPDNSATLLPVTAADGAAYGLSSGLRALHPLWDQGKLAAVANVGMLAEPITRAQFQANSAALPTNLFSHSDQVIQMQTGTPSSSAATGWAGRVADQVTGLNAGVSFPASISLDGQQLFCRGNAVQSASLIPDFDMQPYGLDAWPASAAKARAQALQEVLAFDSGLTLVQAANKVRQDALALSAMLKDLESGAKLAAAFPATPLGYQLRQVARIMQLRGKTGLKRQVFFCSLPGFDTHGSQAWQHWNLLRQAAEAMTAFYRATEEMGIAGQVTTFTESEFSRTLQPSGSGSDHGWGGHFLVLGGAVKGGHLFGQFPELALGGPDDSGSRGVWIPTTSLDQYGATLGRWFGLDDAALASVFPNLSKFVAADLGVLG